MSGASAGDFDKRAAKRSTSADACVDKRAAKPAASAVPGADTLRIVYEDRALVVCIKPAGVFSEDAQPPAAAPGAPQSLPALLRKRWGRPDAYIGVVHRLDVAAAGVMVFAKTPQAAAALSRAIQRAAEAPEAAGAQPGGKSAFCKRYLAVVAGIPEPAAGRMEDFLFRDTRKGKVFVAGRPRRGVKKAVLDYETLETAYVPRGGSLAGKAEAAGGEPAADAFSLVRIQLHTGRTHQIRVQFSSRKHPLWGDGKYGSRKNGALGLWCESLAFCHPVTGKMMEFSALPEKAGAFAPFALPLPDAQPFVLL